MTTRAGSGTDLAEQCARLLRDRPPNTVVSGLAAATLHGLWLPRPADTPSLTSCPEGVQPRAMVRARRCGSTNNRKEIPAHETTRLAGLPITTIERTWWDLAALLSLPDLVAAGDRALQLGADRDRCADLVRRQAGRRGNRTARIALGWLDARSESRPESHLRVLLREGGLDCFEANVAIADRDGGWLARPDLSCRAARIALEYQGAEHADVNRMRRDITRDTDLRRNGWLTLHYGPAETFGRPWLIAPEVRRLTELRAPGLLRPRIAPLPRRPRL